MHEIPERRPERKIDGRERDARQQDREREKDATDAFRYSREMRAFRARYNICQR